MTAIHATHGALSNGNGENSKRRSRGRPRLEEVAEIENDLVEVALQEFLKHGYGGTSMAMIVKAAGISKTTLYSRFSSKEQLFIAMMNKMVEGNLSAQIRAATGPTRPLADMLSEFTRRSLEISLDPVHYGVIRLIYGESHRFPELREAGERLGNAMVSGIYSIIMDYGEREGITFRDPMVPARMLMMTMRGCYLGVLLSQNTTVSDELRDEIDRYVRLLTASINEW